MKIGGSSRKFAQSVDKWDTMPKKGQCPRLLTNVLQAVADLAESKGSRVKTILNHIQTAVNVSNLKPKPRNIVMQVRKAISYGLETGVLRQRAGKFSLSLGKSTSNTSSHEENVVGLRRSKRNAASRDGLKSPTKRMKLTDYASRYTFNSTDSFPRQITMIPAIPREARILRASIPELKSRRRATRNRKRANRRRKRQSPNMKVAKKARTPSVYSAKSSHTKAKSNKSRNSLRPRTSQFQCEQVVNEPLSYDQPHASDEYDRDQESRNNTAECDNPDCLCNLKQEICDNASVSDDEK